MTRYDSYRDQKIDWCQICGRTFDPEFYDEINEPYEQYCQYCHRVLNDYNDTEELEND